MHPQGGPYDSNASVTLKISLLVKYVKKNANKKPSPKSKEKQQKRIFTKGPSPCNSRQRQNKKKIRKPNQRSELESDAAQIGRTYLPDGERVRHHLYVVLALAVGQILAAPRPHQLPGTVYHVLALQDHLRPDENPRYVSGTEAAYTERDLQHLLRLDRHLLTELVQGGIDAVLLYLREPL